MKVGIGVTSDKATLWLDRVEELCADNFYLIGNEDHSTIACDKNKLIKGLYDAGCDYLFIFDDDCFPIKAGWEQFFIDACLKTGVQHFSLCKPEHNTLIGSNDTISLYSTGTGCMMFLTRKVIETVGYINKAYGKYGYEHCAYSLRIQKAALTPAWYVSVNGWEDYIYSWDLDQNGGAAHGFTKQLSRTEYERQALINANEAEWQREQTSSQLYYEY